MTLGFYVPRGSDRQQPHSRDEIYVVATASVTFSDDDDRVPFSPGDAPLVAAGRPHRLEGFSNALAVWSAFYGPEGGEAVAG